MTLADCDVLFIIAFLLPLPRANSKQATLSAIQARLINR